ncbi:RHS repeat-associated protein [Acidovorax sp. 62]|nr:RHS repeat-associated protein [Acidovorax sp. 62]
MLWLPTASGPMPIGAQINGRLYAIDSDHLNTPRRLTNTQGQVVWQWLITGYGEVAPTTGATGYAFEAPQLGGSSNTSGSVYSEEVNFKLRYPGQVWDEETGLSYNLNRYYDAQGGRYIQADPIGLDGGWNRFGYVSGNPLNGIDPQGLYESSPWLRAWVPGQVSFDRGMTALENGNYGAAALSFGTMLGEQVLTAASFGVSRAAKPLGDACEAAAVQTTRVGRWMSQAELDAMKASGRVQESFSGTTHVATPTNASAFINQAKPGSVYVEFNVPSSSLRATNEGWSKIIGPNSLEGRLAGRKGLPLPQMPEATGIVHSATRIP